MRWFLGLMSTSMIARKVANPPVPITLANGLIATWVDTEPAQSPKRFDYQMPMLAMCRWSSSSPTNVTFAAVFVLITFCADHKVWGHWRCVRPHPSMLFEAPGSWHAIALLGSLIYGYQLGVLNTPLQAVASDLGVPIATRGAAIVSALLAGGVFGALAAGNVADFTGPKRAILLADVVLALGCGLSFVPYGGIAALLQGVLNAHASACGTRSSI